MAKVKLAWIENDKVRAKSLKQRREGLLKKVKELAILCAIRACLIIFSPNEAVPMVWPSVEMTCGILDDFFALPKFVQKQKETGVKSILEEKTKTVHEQLMKSNEKNKEHVVDKLMMHLQNGRGIDDLNLSEIHALLSFSKDKIILHRKNLNSMEFSPLRDPPVIPFEVQAEQLTITTDDAFVGSGQGDDKNGKTDEEPRIFNIDTFRENKSYYLIDRWALDPKPLEHVIYQHMRNENPNFISYCPYQGSGSNGNASFEMEPVNPQVMTFHGLVGSTSQPLQHCNMTNNAIMAMNQQFDFMSRELERQDDGNNINNSEFYMTNNEVRQEPPPNETTAREDIINLPPFDINRD
ncbi:PREDICTED: agamous-like MADS-box protein AGL36 [Camelina sativa]|uniref:Agamous-like MADS-box protein AGL36 n=1 Tax=Camelina sativa TaxID=90675 RepID=A0ABM0ZBI6_CAMSA|nr:PREDICTED: agamous-like MADS-box protein AGL36 [Camelina sativa]